jgi:hypothetical protein
VGKLARQFLENPVNSYYRKSSWACHSAPIPPGEGAAQTALDAIKATAAPHPDFERHHPVRKRIDSSTPAGTLTPEEYIEKVYSSPSSPRSQRPNCFRFEDCPCGVIPEDRLNAYGAQLAR